MDLENELRQAMAEHVTEVAAPGTLAAEAKHRHHRTVRRRTALVVGTAGLVVVGVAIVPAYQSFRPQAVGANGRNAGRHAARATNTPLPVSPAPTPRLHAASPSSGSKGSRHSPEPKHSPSTAHVPTGPGAVTSLLGYLPVGISPGESCHLDYVGSKETTSCRWSGSGGWIEVRLIRDGGLKSLGDLKPAPPTSWNFHIHDHPALLSRLPSQVMWIERPGLGVCVEVSPSLTGSLTRVAEGVNVT